MAISKKGLRKIVVNEKAFYWKFNEKIFVTSKEYDNSLLIIDFGWFDVWDYINDEANRPSDFEPRIITPKFVNESIQYAINSGWTNEKKELCYKNNKYLVVND